MKECRTRTVINNRHLYYAPQEIYFSQDFDFSDYPMAKLIFEISRNDYIDQMKDEPGIWKRHVVVNHGNKREEYYGNNATITIDADFDNNELIYFEMNTHPETDAPTS